MNLTTETFKKGFDFVKTFTTHQIDYILPILSILISYNIIFADDVSKMFRKASTLELIEVYSSILPIALMLTIIGYVSVYRLSNNLFLNGKENVRNNVFKGFVLAFMFYLGAYIAVGFESFLDDNLGRGMASSMTKTIVPYVAFVISFTGFYLLFEAKFLNVINGFIEPKAKNSPKVNSKKPAAPRTRNTGPSAKSLKADLEKAKADLEASEKDNGTLKADLEKAKADLKASQKDNGTLKTDLEKAKADLKASEKSNGTLKTDLKKARADLKQEQDNKKPDENKQEPAEKAPTRQRARPTTTGSGDSKS